MGQNYFRTCPIRSHACFSCLCIRLYRFYSLFGNFSGGRRLLGGRGVSFFLRRQLLDFQFVGCPPSKAGALHRYLVRRDVPSHCLQTIRPPAVLNVKLLDWHSPIQQTFNNVKTELSSRQQRHCLFYLMLLGITSSK